MELLEGSVKKHFAKYLVPSVGIAISVALYSLVDTIAIGQGVGPEGAAACAIVLPIFYISNFIALLCGVGGSVQMGKARGEGNTEKGDAYFAVSAVMVAVMITVVWIAGMIFQDQFYRLFGADETILPVAREYGSLIFAFLPFINMVVFLDLFIKADGSPKFALLSTLIGAAINIFGDWLFVFPLGMGMRGAAIATVAGNVFQALFLLSYILLKKTHLKFARPNRWRMAFHKIIATGFGAAVGALAVIAISLIANNQIMKYIGDAALSIYGALATLSAVFTDVFVGIGQSVQPVASQNYGAGKNERCVEALHIGIRTAAVFGLVLSAVCMIFPVEIVSFFMKTTPEIKEIAPYILRVYCASYLPLALNTFMVYYLQAVSRRNQASVISLSRGIVLNGIFLMVFPLLFQGNGIWWAVLIAELITMLMAFVFTMQTKKTLLMGKAE